MDFGIPGILTLTDAGQAIAMISVMISFISALVRRATVDLDKVKDSREKVKDHQKKMREAQKKGDTDQMLKIQEEMTKQLMIQMKQNFKPILITWIPFIVVFKWLADQYGSAGNVANILGISLGWFWWYFVISFLASTVVNKIVQVS